MNQKASSIGSLAARVLSRRRIGEVTRVFQRSVYVRSGDDFVLLLWGEPRSPMAINIAGSGVGQRTRVGEQCILRPDCVVFDSGEVDVRGAQLFQSALLGRRRVVPPPGAALAKGVIMLRSLYEVSPSGPSLITDAALRSFVSEVLTPFTRGERGKFYAPESYLPLIGRGGGFTPAGDDFVGGLLTALNFVARCRRSRQVRIPRSLLHERTIPESAAILRYSAMGHVDEDMGRFVIKTLDGSARFYDELMAVARRGHTSGVDMSLGVLLGEAALTEAGGEVGSLKSCLDAVWRP